MSGSLYLLTGSDSILTSGSGDDSIRNWSINSATIDAGAGNDAVMNYGSYVSIDVGAGDDFVWNGGHHATIDAGSGDDYITNTKPYSVIDAGADNDEINSHGSYVLINAGSGNDTIYNFEGENVSISIGEGSDLLMIGSGTNFVYDFSSGDSIGIYGSASISNSIQSGSDVIISFGDSNSVTLQNTVLENLSVDNGLITYEISSDTGSNTESDTGSNTESETESDTTSESDTGSDSESDTTSYSFNLDGDDTIFADDTRVTIRTADFGSSVYAYGSNNIIDAGTGDDFIYSDGESVTIDAGSGKDTVINGDIFFWTDNVSINAGDGDDFIENYGDSVTIDAGSGNDSILNGNSYFYSDNISINAGDGDDVIENHGDSTTIDAGTGDDFIENDGDYVIIDGGTGDDTIIAGSGAEVFQYAAGDGNDLIRNFSGEDVIQITEGSISSYSISNGDLIFNIGSENLTLKNMANHYITVIDAEGNSSNQLYTNGTTQKDVIQSILGAAANSTLTNTTDILDEAIKATNTTVFSGIQDALDKFKADQITAGDADTFLRDYVGIDLNNADTGAITGWDAGGSAIKNAEDIVPESGSVSTPTDSSFTIDGLTFTFSTNLTDSEQTIVDELYSWWIESSMDLLYDSYGLDFENGTQLFDTVKLDFDTSSDALAYTSWDYLFEDSPTLNINPDYYGSIVYGDENGDPNNIYAEYLDRTVAHEFTHLLQYTKGMIAEYKFFGEGMAELTQGIDDFRDEDIAYLADDPNLLSAYVDLATVSSADLDSTGYAAGYMFWRYLAKQIADNYVAGTGSDSGSGSDTTSDTGSEVETDTGSETVIEETGSTLVNDTLVATSSVSGSFSANTSVIGLAIYSHSISGSLVADSKNYVSIDRVGNLIATDTSSADEIIAVDSSNYSASMTVTSGDNFEFEFMGGTAISQWNATLSSGNDTIKISNITGGNINSGSGNDFFSVSSDLNGNLTLSGDAGNSQFADVFYSQSKTATIPSEQNIITVTDVDFNNGDVLLIDAGVENLTADFFGDAQFKDFANAEQASTTALYAKNVFDASKLAKDRGMDFSMVKMADSSVSVGRDNEIDEDDITNVVWTNSNAATIDFSKTQDGSALIFTNTNNRGDVVSLGGDFDDTIHAGAKDTIFSGDGNDIIYAEGKSAIIDGNDGDDTIIASGLSHIVYDNNAVGDDLVQNWSSSNVINLNEMPESMSISDGKLILESGVGTMSIEGSESFSSSTDIKYELNGTSGIARVADEDLIVEYDRNVTYYDGVNNGTLNISTSSNAVVNLTNDSKHISRVDASSTTGRVDISGDSLNNTIQGGTKNSTLWGGGGDDVLIGGDGKDVFRYNSNDGNVTIQGGNSNDIIDLEMNFSDVSSYEFNGNGVVLAIGNNSLNIVGTSTTEFNFSDGTHTADYSEQKFS